MNNTSAVEVSTHAVLPKLSSAGACAQETAGVNNPNAIGIKRRGTNRQ